MKKCIDSSAQTQIKPAYTKKYFVLCYSSYLLILSNTANSRLGTILLETVPPKMHYKYIHKYALHKNLLTSQPTTARNIICSAPTLGTE